METEIFVYVDIAGTLHLAWRLDDSSASLDLAMSVTGYFELGEDQAHEIIIVGRASHVTGYLARRSSSFRTYE